MLLLNDPRNFRMFAPDSGTNEGDDWTDELQQELDEFEGDLQDAFENGSPVGVSSEPGAAVHIQEDGKFFEYEIGPEVFLY